MRTRIAAASVLVALTMACSLYGEEQRLTYKTAAGLNRAEGFETWWHFLQPESKPGDAALPADAGYRTVYAKWPAAPAKDGYVWIAAVRSTERGAYDRVYVDTNCNGRLDDEEPTEASGQQPNSATAGPIEVDFSGAGGPAAYHINVMLEGYQGRELLHGYQIETCTVAVTSGCWYEGTVRVGGRDLGCRLVDYNSNGTFDDASLAMFDSDRILLKDGDKPWEDFWVGKYIFVGGKLCTERVARDGSRIDIAESGPVPMGTIKFGSDVTRFEVTGAGGQLVFEPATGSALVPAGTWRVVCWKITRPDSQGVEWSLLNVFFPDTSGFSLGEGQEKTVPAGEPVTAALKVSGPIDGQYTITEAVTTALGGTVKFQRQGKDIGPARVRIHNADGSYDEIFSLEAG